MRVSFAGVRLSIIPGSYISRTGCTAWHEFWYSSSVILTTLMYYETYAKHIILCASLQTDSSVASYILCACTNRGCCVAKKGVVLTLSWHPLCPIERWYKRCRKHCTCERQRWGSTCVDKPPTVEPHEQDSTKAIGYVTHAQPWTTLHVTVPIWPQSWCAREDVARSNVSTLSFSQCWNSRMIKTPDLNLLIFATLTT